MYNTSPTSTCTCNHVHVVIPVDGVDGEDGVPSDVGVAMLQAGSDGRHQRLQEFRLLQLAEEAQRRAANELIGMLEILRTERERERRGESELHVIPFIHYNWAPLLGCIHVCTCTCMREREGEGKGERAIFMGSPRFYAAPRLSITYMYMKLASLISFTHSFLTTVEKSVARSPFFEGKLIYKASVCA